ncbi:HvfB family MNIO-type RiPP peptide maturase [Nevskia ramosa]|uniref:HvfB family MNIO-type RiPP peptide maturase n=1 Tax=Nevskia ramosa TaxID=64002 RepID=UPI003D0DFB9D
MPNPATTVAAPRLAQPAAVRGAGLGLRRALLEPLAELKAGVIDFLEIAPENWMQLGGRFGRQFRALAERYPFAAHGLSLSLGGPAPLDESFVLALKRFLDEHGIADYSEHLSYCSDARGQLYDLMPIPHTEEAVAHVAARIRRVQELLERRIAVENVSTYAAPGQRISELAFINAVIAEADCDLLLDVNNIHVNSINHGYDASAFLDGLPLSRVRYVHIAGHHAEAHDLCIDTHGADVIDPVWALLAQACAKLGPLPTLLERDFNLPPLASLLVEIDQIRAVQARHAPTQAATARG